MRYLEINSDLCMCLPLLPARGGWRAVPGRALGLCSWCPGKRALVKKYRLFPVLPRPQGSGLGGKGAMVGSLPPPQHGSLLLWPHKMLTGSLCLAPENGASGRRSTACLGTTGGTPRLVAWCFTCHRLGHASPRGARGHFWKSRACSLLAPRVLSPSPWVLSLVLGPRHMRLEVVPAHPLGCVMATLGLC